MMKTSAPRHQAAARGSCSAAAALQRGRLSNGRPQQQQRAIAACAAPSDSNPCSTSGRSIEEASLRGVDRRALLGATLTLSAARALGLSPAAQAFVEPPQGFRVWTDKLDGYSFVYPDSWLAVTVTGNDCFFRNPRNVDENLFVDISSPSSSFYNTVTDLGTPDQTAKQILSQYLDKEFMSTRLGIRREGQILSASSRQGEDGRTYFDVAIRMTSFASRSPYLATQGEVLKDYGVEWDRVLITTLGVANNRLYELRLQTAQTTLDKSLPVLQQISQSFTLKEVEKA